MIIRVTPDVERAKSIYELANIRKNYLKSFKKDTNSIIVCETYYEIIKELASIIFLLDGLKAIGENAHKELIDGLSKYKEFDESEINLMQDLRIKRNKSSYEGEQFEKIYLENHRLKFEDIILKLEKFINKGLEEDKKI